MEPAAADELSGAFERFRASGKPILRDEPGLLRREGVTTSTYELAAATGNIWMQPSSSFQATGLAAEDIFYKRFFDRYGITADYQQRYEYKNAVNPYLYDDYTPAHRESELGWMGSVYQSGLSAAAAPAQDDAGRAEGRDRGWPIFGRGRQGQGTGGQHRRGEGG